MNTLLAFNQPRGAAPPGNARAAGARRSAIHPAPAPKIESRPASAQAGTTAMVVTQVLLLCLLLGGLALRLIRYWPLH